MGALDKDNTMGRPTKYKPEYCLLMEEMLSEGASFTEFRAEIGGVTQQTLHNWKAAYPDFLDAYTRAEVLGQAHWEKKLRTELMMNKDSNPALVKLYFANRFKWTDKAETNHTSSDGSMSPAKGKDLDDFYTDVSTESTP